MYITTVRLHPAFTFLSTTPNLRYLPLAPPINPHHTGHYVKDLSLLNREIQQTIIVDNSPMSYIFHPENAIDCSSFFDDPTDVELWQVRLLV